MLLFLPFLKRSSGQPPSLTWYEEHVMCNVYCVIRGCPALSDVSALSALLQWTATMLLLFSGWDGGAGYTGMLIG